MRSDKAESPWSPDAGAGGEGSCWDPMMSNEHDCDADWRRPGRRRRVASHCAEENILKV